MLTHPLAFAYASRHAMCQSENAGTMDRHHVSFFLEARVETRVKILPMVQKKVCFRRKHHMEVIFM